MGLMVITFFASFIDAIKGISAPDAFACFKVIKLATLLSVISLLFNNLTEVLNPIVILLLAATSTAPFVGVIVTSVSPEVVTVKDDEVRLVSFAEASSTAARAT